jgi:hypothetical protein
LGLHVLGHLVAARATARKIMPSCSRTTIRAAVVMAMLVSLLVAVPASATTANGCRVRNIESGVTYHTLRAAVSTAHWGDHLTVRGVCRGTTTIRKDLHISGLHSASTGRPVLRGDDPGSVVRVLGKARVS